MAANTCSQPPEFENGTGSVNNYTLNFEYINREDVLVYVGTEAPYTQYTLGSASNANEYEWVNDSTIRLNAASGTNNVVFLRVTDRCDPIVEFFAGTSIRAQDLNDNQEQVLFLIQEIVGGLKAAGLDVQLPNDKIDLDDLGDVDVDGATDRSWLYFNGTKWVNGKVLKSTEDWNTNTNNTTIATTATIDANFLNSDGSDLIAGPGIAKQAGGGTVTLNADINSEGGLSFSGSGITQQIRVKDGNGIVVNGGGVNVGQGTGITVSANAVAVTSQTLWGQNHDHSASVSGDVSDVGTVQFGSGATYQFPETDGSNGQVLTTNSSGTLSWTDKTEDTIVTYSVNVPDGTTDIQLNGSNNVDSKVTLTAGSNVDITRNAANQLTITADNDNTTYTLVAVENGDDVDLQLKDQLDNVTDTVTIKAGLNISITSVSAGEFTLNSTGGGSGSGGATIVSNISELDTAGGLPPSAGALYMVLDSTGATSASPTINGLPTAPGSGWSSTYTILVQWDGVNSRWQFIRYDVADPDAQYVLKAGDTMTGALVVKTDDTFPLNVQNSSSSSKFSVSNEGKVTASETIQSRGNSGDLTQTGAYMRYKGSSVAEIGAWRNGVNSCQLDFATTTTEDDEQPTVRMSIEPSGDLEVGVGRNVNELFRLGSTGVSRGNIQISHPYLVDRYVYYGNNLYAESAKDDPSAPTSVYKQASSIIGGGALRLSAPNSGFGGFSFISADDPDNNGGSLVTRTPFDLKGSNGEIRHSTYSTTSSGFTGFNYGDTGYYQVNYGSANGTASDPESLNGGQVIGRINFSAYTPQGFLPSASIMAYSGGVLTSAAALEAGKEYQVVEPGTTNWQLVGAANGNVGTVFTATGTTGGSGKAYLTGGNSPAAMTFRTRGADTNTTLERMRIHPDGQVTVGTSYTPSAHFEVRSVANDGANWDVAKFGDTRGLKIYQRTRTGSSNAGDLTEFDKTSASGSYRFRNKDRANLLYIDGGSQRVGVNVEPKNANFEVVGVCQIDRPSDFWSTTLDFYDLGYGNIASQHSYGVHLTCNGYRTATSGQWQSLDVNSKTGVSQIGLHPEGYIAFNVDDNLADGGSAIITEAARVHTNGYFGIQEIAPTTPLDVGGTIKTAVTAITSSGVADFLSGNIYTIAGGVTVFNPTNAEVGMSGLFVLSGNPANWGTKFKFPGGEPPSPSEFPAIVPFYVAPDSSDVKILCGDAVSNITR